jgi:hypothetical protein
MRLRSLKLNQGDSIMELRIIEKLDNILKLLKGEQLEDGFMDINGVVKWSSLSKSSIRRACAEGRLKYVDSQVEFTEF